MIRGRGMIKRYSERVLIRTIIFYSKDQTNNLRGARRKPEYKQMTNTFRLSDLMLKYLEYSLRQGRQNCRVLFKGKFYSFSNTGLIFIDWAIKPIGYVHNLITFGDFKDRKSKHMIMMASVGSCLGFISLRTGLLYFTHHKNTGKVSIKTNCGIEWFQNSVGKTVCFYQRLFKTVPLANTNNYWTRCLAVSAIYTWYLLYQEHQQK